MARPSTATTRPLWCEEQDFPSAGREAAPRHVLLLPDGDRRWARQRGVSICDGYRAGARAIERVIDACQRRGVAFLTVQLISPRNRDRPADDNHSMAAVMHSYVVDRLQRYHREGVRFRMIGDVQRLAGAWASLIDPMLQWQRETASHTGMIVNLGLNYSGRDEIIRAVRRLIELGVPAHAVDEALFAGQLDTADQPDVDVVLRTGGGRRLSDVLPYQAAYAELRFTETLLPDLETAEVEAMLDSFALRRYSQ